LLIEIYLKRIIEVNNSNLLNKVYAEVHNPANLPLELAVNRNPFTPIGIKIVDPQAQDGESNKFSVFNQGKEAHTNTLIECLKHHQEYYYNKYGRPISSAKDQSLSSDAVLSVQSSVAVAAEHD
jgi:hypothetical protein